MSQNTKRPLGNNTNNTLIIISSGCDVLSFKRPGWYKHFRTLFMKTVSLKKIELWNKRHFIGNRTEIVQNWFKNVGNSHVCLHIWRAISRILEVHLHMRSWGHLKGTLQPYLIAFLDFKISPFSECCTLSSGQLPCVYTDVSERPVCSIFIGRGVPTCISRWNI